MEGPWWGKMRIYILCIQMLPYSESYLFIDASFREKLRLDRCHASRGVLYFELSTPALPKLYIQQINHTYIFKWRANVFATFATKKSCSVL